MISEVESMVLEVKHSVEKFGKLKVRILPVGICWMVHKMKNLCVTWIKKSVN